MFDYYCILKTADETSPTWCDIPIYITIIATNDKHKAITSVNSKHCILYFQLGNLLKNIIGKRYYCFVASVGQLEKKTRLKRQN